MDMVPNSYASLRAILCQLRDLLETYSDSNRQARAGYNHVGNAIALLDENALPQLRDALNSLALWGGAGSIFDLWIGASDGRGSADLPKNKLLRELLNVMLVLDLAAPRVEGSATTLDRMISHGKAD